MKKKLLKIATVVLATAYIMVFISGCKKESEDDPPETVKDIEGNTYSTVIIGTQTWLVQNLTTTKYNDGSEIPNLTVDDDWTSTSLGAYCWYENNSTNKNIYGALYNWFAASSGKLCPTGWHVPAKTEVEALFQYLGGDLVAGGKLKEKGTTHWSDPNVEATNSSGFTALPGGSRFVSDYGSGASFTGIADRGQWWTTTPYPNQTTVPHAYLFDIWYDDAEVGTGSRPRTSGMSVRCIKD